MRVRRIAMRMKYILLSEAKTLPVWRQPVGSAVFDGGCDANRLFHMVRTAQ
jgi:hypothetical protein